MSGLGKNKECHECGISAFTLKMCSQCQKVQYCSTTCQKKAWKQHKDTCKPVATVKMSRNSAGGATYEITDWQRLNRFLILGAESNTYYACAPTLLLGNATTVKRLITTDGPKVVKTIYDMSIKGSAAKQDNILFVLAMCARLGDEATRKLAYEKLPEICRIPTHWFTFLNFSTSMILQPKQKTAPKVKAIKGKAMTKADKQQARLEKAKQQKEAFEAQARRAQQLEEIRLQSVVSPVGQPAQPAVVPVKVRKIYPTQPPMMGRGWGTLAKRAFSKIYNGKSVDVAYLITKYQNRNGWSHKDVLRLAHVKPIDEEHGFILNYIINGASVLPDMPAGNTKAFLLAVENIKTASVEEALKLIRTHRLAREHLPTGLLSEPAVWRALLEEMPMGALLRNLGKLTALEVLNAACGPETQRVVQRFTNEAEIKKARLHPFNILVALKAYAAGGEASKGSIRYKPIPAITAALDKAYDLAFANVAPTGKRCLLGMDVSGSMTWGKVIGSDSITPRQAAAAMAMTFMRKESNCTPVAFSDRIVPFPMNAGMSLDTVCRLCDKIQMGGTYCDLPMTWALENRVPIDVFMIFTDCETATRSMTPAAALKKYRQVMDIDAKLIVFGFTSTGFTLADPADSGMLDMVGFDASAPEAVRNFMLGQL